MIYKVNKTINLSESRKNYEHCPDGLHSHQLFFTIAVKSESDEIEVMNLVNDVLTENTVFMNSAWKLSEVVKIMKDELESAKEGNIEFAVLSVSVRISDLFGLEVIYE